MQQCCMKMMYVPITSVSVYCICIADINDCDISEPCNGHGECTDSVAGYTCDCDDGYTGETCDTSKCFVYL